MSKKDSPDHVYYNMNLQNNGSTAVPARFNSSLPASILNNVKDYYFSVIRWSADGSVLPIMIFPNETTDPLLITLTYLGVDYQAQMTYAATGSSFYAPYGNVVYSYQAFAQSVTAALAAAYALIPGNPAGAAPYMIYDIMAERFYIIANNFYLDNAVNPINIFMNSALYYYFDNFQEQFFGENLPSGKDYRIKVIDHFGTNPGPIANTYKILQETSALFRLFDLDTIQFISNTIPVRYEYTSGINNTDQIFSAGNSGSGPPVLQLITDFCPALNGPNQARDTLVYVPSGQYRLADLLDLASGIKNLDLSMYWTDRTGKQYQWLIPPKTGVTVKLLFVKKGSEGA